jgi:hypothetical protein
MTSAKPASLPPMLIVTSAVSAVTAPIWLARTSPVLAPEQATNENADGALELAQSCG